MRRYSSLFQGFILVSLLFVLSLTAGEVVILNTTDIHSANCMPQLATLVRQEYAQSGGKKKVLLIDCGDTAQGGIASALSKGRCGMEYILQLPYDVWVPGNHEFDYGVDAAANLFQLGFQAGSLLCCNLTFNDGIGKGFSAQMKGWRLFERDGLRIAVIGAEASFFHNWLLPSDYQRIHNTRVVDELERRILPEIGALKPAADIIILAMHHGWNEGRGDKRGVNEVNLIARKFPEIDLILGGHTHRTFPGRKIGVRTWYMQAGCHGEFLGKIVMKKEPKQPRATVVSSRLLTVPVYLAPDAALVKAQAVYDTQASALLDEDLGVTLFQPIRQRRKRPGEGNEIAELLCASIAHASQAQAAFHGILTRAEIPTGKITRRTLLAVIPYENTIVTMDLTREEIEEIMTEQWSFRSSSRYQGPWNLKFSKDEQGRAILLQPKLNPGERLKVAMNNHAAAGSGAAPVLRKIISRPEVHLTNTGISTREAVARYLQQAPASKPPQGISVSSH